MLVTCQYVSQYFESVKHMMEIFFLWKLEGCEHVPGMQWLLTIKGLLGSSLPLLISGAQSAVTAKSRGTILNPMARGHLDISYWA
jgi:hypothetical protein